MAFSSSAPAVTLLPRPQRRVVSHGVVSLHRTAASGSERITQIVMGRTVLVHATQNDWSFVETEDTYRGWVESRWLDLLTTRLLSRIRTIFGEVRETPRATAPLVVRLPYGAALQITPPHSVREEWVAATLADGKTHGWLPAVAVPATPAAPPLPEMMAKIAAERGRDLLGTPYLWGGSTPFGLDCSGFVQLCYQMIGVLLRRDADIQQDDPRFIPVSEHDFQPGDLLFFGKPDAVNHVGMWFADGEFIHAARGFGVARAKWSDSEYTARFVEARRLDPARAADSITRPAADRAPELPTGTHTSL